MKNRKFISIFSAAVITLSVGLTAFTACGDECEHVYNIRETLIPATCMTEGKEKLSCVFCNDSYEQVIPINPEAHGYGVWDIQKPTESATGTATTVCSYNASHVHTVTLPKLTEEGTGYTSSDVTKQPTALKDGERTFVLADTAGDISFKVPVPARGIQTVADAVEVAVAGKNQVRRSYGRAASDRRDVITENFYEFGDKYTHIIDNVDRYESWYSYDEKNRLFGIRRDNVEYSFNEGMPVSPTVAGDKPRQDPVPNAKLMNGVRVAMYYSSSVSQFFYGAEGCLNEVYALKVASVNGDAYEEIVKDEESGETVYKFGYGSFGGMYFCEIKAEFTLTETFALKHLIIESYDYDNTYQTKYEQDPETKYYRVVDGAEPGGIELIEFTNTTEAELSPEEAAAKPVNPYPANALQLKSLDVIESSTGKAIDENTVVSTTTNQLVNSVLRIANVENVGEGINDITYDPVSLYLRTSGGDELLNFQTHLRPNIGITGTISGNYINIRSQRAGDFTLVLKSRSGSLEKLIKMHFNSIAPSKIMPSYNKYGNSGYTWQTTTNSSISATVYVNQPLPFRADVPNEEISFAGSDFKASVTSSNASNATITDKDGGVKEFKATRAGSYTIKLASALNSSRTCTISVTVKAAPQKADLFGNNTYTGNLRQPYRGPVTVVCNADNDTITITRTQGSTGTQTEVLHIDSYNPATGELVTSHYAGATDLHFKVTVNEAFDLVLSHPTGFGSEEESVILIKK